MIEAKENPSKVLPLSQKDRIEILLHEYDALRDEIVNRTNFGYQIAAAAALAITWLMQQELSHKGSLFWSIVGAVTVLFLVASFVDVRDLKRAAFRVRELEGEINSRAGEHLLVWETLSGVLTRMGLLRSFLASAKPLDRKNLPKLDPAYLDQGTAGRADV